SSEQFGADLRMTIRIDPLDRFGIGRIVPDNDLDLSGKAFFNGGSQRRIGQNAGKHGTVCSRIPGDRAFRPRQLLLFAAERKEPPESAAPARVPAARKA